MVKWSAFLPLGKAQPPDPDKFVLVPPMFERDIKDRDRFCYSSYFYAFGKRQLKYLFEDYLHSPSPQDRVIVPRGTVLFAPPTDPRVSIAASVAHDEALMNVRFQPLGSSNSATFVDVNVTPQRLDLTSVRCSLFDPASGVGAFLTAPLTKRITNARAQAGLRYSSPTLSTGLVMEPASSRLSGMWLVGRYQGVVAGMHLQPSKTGLPTSLEALRQQAHVALAYEPSFRSAAGVGQFSASMELQEGRQLLVSFFQHMAVVRQVVNPLEDHKSVVGITNYVDLGIQIAIPTATDEAKQGEDDSSMMRVAAAWQLNKSWLLKARVSDKDACVAAAFKTWGRLGLVAAANVSYRYGDAAGVRYGALIQLENFGEKRYERGVSEVSGKAVLQRHVASQVDIDNLQGTGRMVRLDAPEQDYNVTAVDQTADYL